MVSGADEVDELILRGNQLPGNKSLSSISIPSAYQYYHQGGNGDDVLLQSNTYLPSSSTSSSRGRRTIGPGYYHRTLSSSSLLSNKSSVAKSRSDYCTVTKAGQGAPLTKFYEEYESEHQGQAQQQDQHERRRPNYQGGSSSNIQFIDRSFDHQPFVYQQQRTRERERDRYSNTRLTRDSSKPIIVHVPITAPKATATTISRATSPPPFSIQQQQLTCSSGIDGDHGEREVRGKPGNPNWTDGAAASSQNPTSHSTSTSSQTDLRGQIRVSKINKDPSPSTGPNDDVKEDEEMKSEEVRSKVKSHIQIQINLDEEIPKVKEEKGPFEALIKVQKTPAAPPKLGKYCRNAKLKKVRHPLEENIFASLLITLVAVGVALVLGLPVLILTGGLLLIAVVVRYSLATCYGCCLYLRYICSNRQRSMRYSAARILPRERLALGNDTRWLGRKGPRQCQSILHTILVFEGTMDLAGLRHLVQNRVLRQETLDGELAYPRLMHNLLPLPGGWRWELDVTFDIQNHIFAGPGQIRTESQMQSYIGSLLTERLPMGKPLWEMRVLTNYGVQRETLAILRVHQALADGMSLVRILSHSLADHAQLHIPQRPHFAGMSFGFNVIRSLIVGPVTLFMWLCTTFRDKNLLSVPLDRLLREKSLKENSESSVNCDRTCQANNKSGAGDNSDNPDDPSSDIDDSSPTTFNESEEEIRGRSRRGFGGQDANKRDSDSNKTTLNAGVGVVGRTISIKKIRYKVTAASKMTASSTRRGRRKKKRGVPEGKVPTWNVVWAAPISVPKVSRVKQIMRSSLNDVLLSAAAGSVRICMQQMGIPFPDDVKVVIPVDLRNDVLHPKSSTKLGCKVASVLAQIPSGIEAAIPRLWMTRHRLDELKASADPVVAYGATSILMNLLPQQVAVSLLDRITDKASLQFSNLPGPTSTLVVGGCPLKGIYPIYPPGGNIRLGISVFTYADQVHLTVVSHPSLKNTGPSILQGIYSEVDQLSKQLSARRVPGESRRSTRNHSIANPEMQKPPTRQIHMQLQVVQEELQELSHRLDTRVVVVEPPPGIKPPCRGIELEEFRSSEESIGAGISSLSPVGQAQLRTRLKTLKTEFSELIGELRRRSSVVEGVAMSFEDEEMEEDFRKPRKRALSVVSVTRRNSLFSTSRSMNTPDSSICYSSEDEEMPSSPSGAHDLRHSPYHNPTGTALRHSSSPIRTTAV